MMFIDLLDDDVAQLREQDRNIRNTTTAGRCEHGGGALKKYVRQQEHEACALDFE